MKKTILAIGVIALFIGMAVIPVNTASTLSCSIETKEKTFLAPDGIASALFADVEGIVTIYDESPPKFYKYSTIYLDDGTITPAFFGETITVSEGLTYWSDAHIHGFFIHWEKFEPIEDSEYSYAVKGKVFWADIWLFGP